jgi:hypothetical protein
MCEYYTSNMEEFVKADGNDKDGRASVSVTGLSRIPRSKESRRERTKAKVPEMRMVEAGWAKRLVSMFEAGSGFQGR